MYVIVHLDVGGMRKERGEAGDGCTPRSGKTQVNFSSELCDERM